MNVLFLGVLPNAMAYPAKIVHSINSKPAHTPLGQQEMAEIMKGGRDAAARVYDAAESGQLLDALLDRKEPSVTAVGRFVDKQIDAALSVFKRMRGYFKWNTEKSKTAETARVLFYSMDFESQEDVEPSSCPSMDSSELACLPMATGLNMTGRVNNCTFSDRVFYYVHFTPALPITNSKAARLQACINEYITQCKNSCFTCWHDFSGGRKTGTSNFTYEYNSRSTPSRKWNVLVEAPEEMYVHTQMITKLASEIIIEKCEQEEQAESFELISGLIVGGFVTASLAAVGGMVYCRYRCPQRFEEEQEVLMHDDEMELRSENEIEEEKYVTGDSEDYEVGVPKNVTIRVIRDNTTEDLDDNH